MTAGPAAAPKLPPNSGQGSIIGGSETAEKIVPYRSISRRQSAVAFGRCRRRARRASAEGTFGGRERSRSQGGWWSGAGLRTAAGRGVVWARARPRAVPAGARPGKVGDGSGIAQAACGCGGAPSQKGACCLR